MLPPPARSSGTPLRDFMKLEGLRDNLESRLLVAENIAVQDEAYRIHMDWTPHRLNPVAVHLQKVGIPTNSDFQEPGI